MLTASAMSLLLGGLTLTSSLSTSRRQAPAPTGISQSRGFNLIFNVTVPGTDFPGHPIDGLALSAEHVGAGLAAAIAGSTPVDLLYTVNGTIQTGVSGSGTTPGATTTLWEGLEMTGPAADEPFVYPLVLQLMAATPGLGVPTAANGGGGDDDGQACLAAFAPLVGTFAVCDTGYVDVPEVPEYEVVFVKGNSTGWYVAQNIPDNCVAVKLLPQCSSDESVGTEEGVEEVLCYEDVSTIDWSLRQTCS